MLSEPWLVGTPRCWLNIGPNSNLLRALLSEVGLILWVDIKWVNSSDICTVLCWQLNKMIPQVFKNILQRYDVMIKCVLFKGQKSLAIIILLCTVRGLSIKINNFGWVGPKLIMSILIGAQPVRPCSYRHICDSPSLHGCCGCRR